MNVWTQIWLTVATAAGAVLAAFLSAWIRQGAAYLAAKIERIHSAALREALLSADAEAEQLALAFVTALNQTVVNDLKAKGAFTPEAAQAVRAQALAMLQTALSPRARETLRSARGDPDALLGAYVERAVSLAPNRRAALPSPPGTQNPSAA